MKKTLVASLLALALAPSAFAMSPVVNATFTHFHDYNAETRAYSKKSHSALGRAQSAELLINGTTGLCFAGVAERADVLIEQMIDIYNGDEANEGGELALTHFEVVNASDYKKQTLRFAIGQRTPDGVAQIEFDRVRRCL